MMFHQIRQTLGNRSLHCRWKRFIFCILTGALLVQSSAKTEFTVSFDCNKKTKDDIGFPVIELWPMGTVVTEVSDGSFAKEKHVHPGLRILSVGFKEWRGVHRYHDIGNYKAKDMSNDKFHEIVSSALMRVSEKILVVITFGFVPLVQRPDIRISKDLRKKILELYQPCRHTETLRMKIDQTAEKINLPNGIFVNPCQSKDIPIDDESILNQLYQEIETHIKIPILEAYREKCRHPLFQKAQKRHLKDKTAGYHMDDDIVDKELHLEFPRIGARALHKLPPPSGSMERILFDSMWTAGKGFHWVDTDDDPCDERDSTNFDKMVKCKVYLTEHNHGCRPHIDIVSQRTNLNHIPAVLSVSILESKGEGIRYNQELRGRKYPMEMIPLNREECQVTLIPPGIEHAVGNEKNNITKGTRISMTILCEFMTNEMQELYLKDTEVHNSFMAKPNLEGARLMTDDEKHEGPIAAQGPIEEWQPSSDAGTDA